MRNSSMKSVVAALSITVTLLAAAPTATARATQQPRDAQAARNTRDDGTMTDRFATGVRQLVARTLRRLGVTNGPSIPIPKQTEKTSDPE